MSLVELEGLEVAAPSATLVDQLSLRLDAGQVLALVGESGSGKSVTAAALGGVLPQGLTARWQRLTIGGQALANAAALAPLRGRTVALMPQDPSGALDPVMRVGGQIAEVLQRVAHLPARELRGRVSALLSEVGFSDPEVVARQYPHQLSGGMRQRALLAATLAAGPRVLIADEPTTALDASLRRGVLELLERLATRRGLALLLITHDLAAAESIADQVLVLYAGRVAELGALPDVFSRPRHPYTAGLLAARLDHDAPRVLPGAVPGIAQRPPGCRFAPRCDRATDVCAAQPGFSSGVACHHRLGGS
ncbi:MAG: ABC transporter ATP-binding protein [Myxococcaceae bacterium]|nr:ABC transporter ATP-binding protein [Myxococcaceae bacterium]